MISTYERGDGRMPESPDVPRSVLVSPAAKANDTINHCHHTATTPKATTAAAKVTTPKAPTASGRDKIAHYL